MNIETNTKNMDTNIRNDTMSILNVNNTTETTNGNNVTKKDTNSVVSQSIYRFKLSEDVSQQLKYFAQIHKHDDRKTFKEAWSEWAKEYELLIRNETTRLIDIGYTGDVLKKMYVSVRYYYKNKSNKIKTTNDTKKRRQYIKLDSSVLQLMDTHVQQNIQNVDYKPAKGFTNFIEENCYTIDKEIERLITNSTLNKDDVDLKLKKTYKNRYYIFTKKD